jgi:hypothetical protein
MSTKSHTHKRCRTLRKKIFSTIRYAEIHKQRPFFDNRKDISKIVVLKIQTGEHIHWCLFYAYAFSFLKNIKNSIFGSISKFSKLIVFWQILADLAILERFCYMARG